MNWEDGVRENYKVLDKIDFLPQLKAKSKLEEVMEWAEDAHTHLIPEEWDGCLFNWISEEELVDYLKRRYPNLKIVERQIYYSYFLIIDDYKEKEEE